MQTPVRSCLLDIGGGCAPLGACAMGEGADASLRVLLQAQKCLMGDAETADCVVVVNDVEFACHRCILAGTSTFFRAMLFTSGMREQTQRRVVLEELSLPVWGVVHEYLYTRQVSDALFHGFHQRTAGEEDCLLSTMNAAERFDLPALMDAASAAMVHRMRTVDAAPRLANAWSRYACAPRGVVVEAALETLRQDFVVASGGHGLCGLPVECLTILLRADDLDVADEDTVLAIVLRVLGCAAHAPPVDAGWVAALLGCVRWGLVTPSLVLGLREGRRVAGAAPTPDGYPGVPRRALTHFLDDAMRVRLDAQDSHFLAAARPRCGSEVAIHLVAGVDVGAPAAVGRSPPALAHWADWQVVADWACPPPRVLGALSVTLRVRSALGDYAAHVPSPPVAVTGAVVAYTLPHAWPNGEVPTDADCFFASPVASRAKQPIKAGGAWQTVHTVAVGGAAVRAALAGVAADAGGACRGFDPTCHVGVGVWLQLRVAG